MASSAYEVRLAPAAARAMRKLDAKSRDRIVRAVVAQAARAASAASGRRGGKSVKALQGKSDRFFRLRVGDHRAIYDVIEEERVLLVLGVVHRRDLDRWLRGR